MKLIFFPIAGHGCVRIEPCEFDENLARVILPDTLKNEVILPKRLFSERIIKKLKR